MKAQEYFEKYYKDIEPTEPNLIKAGKQMCNDFNDEVGYLMEQRKCKSDSVALAIVKELNQKWNSVVEKVHKHYGFKCLKRNVIWNHYTEGTGFERKPD